jgi:hypothetical protein
VNGQKYRTRKSIYRLLSILESDSTCAKIQVMEICGLLVYSYRLRVSRNSTNIQI